VPIVTGEITEDGAVIDALVGVSRSRRGALLRVGFAVPEPVAVRAPLDTGSFACAFMPEVFQRLGVEALQQIPVRTPSTRPGEPHICGLYDVELTLVSNGRAVPFRRIQAIASDDFDRDGVQALIGRDVLDACVLEYCGPHLAFSLAF
jgi:hypothetical protein